MMGVSILGPWTMDHERHDDNDGGTSNETARPGEYQATAHGTEGFEMPPQRRYVYGGAVGKRR